MKRPLIAKVGGSLFDLPDLRKRLFDWIAEQDSRPIVFVPGGGDAADAVRKLDAIHGLGEEASHWLAIRAMSVGAWFLGALGGWEVTNDVGQLGQREHISPNCPVILDAVKFCQTDQRLPHSWRTTSDSIAARVAASCEGDLVLLKSADLPAGISWREAASAGLVDDAFSEMTAGLNVQWVNLRARNIRG